MSEWLRSFSKTMIEANCLAFQPGCFECLGTHCMQFGVRVDICTAVHRKVKEKIT